MTKERRRQLGIAAAVIAVALGAWLARYTVFLDFPAYVEELSAESQAEINAGMGEALEAITEGDLEAGSAAMDRLTEDVSADLPAGPRDELTEEQVEAVADELAAVELFDPARRLPRTFQLAGLRADGAEDRCRRGLDWLAARRGPHARLVLWLNADRCDEVVAQQRERAERVAAVERGHLTDAQREAVDRICEAHGAALLPGILDVHRALEQRLPVQTLRQAAEWLAEHPPSERSIDALYEAVYAFEETLEDRDHALGYQCSLARDLHAGRYAEVLLGGCPDHADEPPLFVDLDEGEVLTELPAEAERTAASPLSGEAMEAIDDLTAGLRDAARGGELPDDVRAEPLLAEAMDRSSCIIRYEPLGYYEEADVRVICADGTRVYHVTAP